MIEKIKFIHSADLHLDSPFKGLKQLPQPLFQRIKDSTFQAFTRVIDLAIEEKVDFVLFAGDLFDQETRSLRALVKLREGLYRLHVNGIQAFIIHGNHDHLSGDYAQVTYPENVHIFSKNVEVIPFVKADKVLAHIYGFSYEQRAVTESMTAYYQKKEGAAFHIGMLHGNLSGKVDHDPYAPFTIEELLSKQFDYWALGHIHKRQVLHENPTILYPGNIQGRHSKETGEKGCYVVEVNKNHTVVKFSPVAEIEWEKVEVAIDEIETFDLLLLYLQELKDDFRQKQVSTLLLVKFIGNGPLHSILKQNGIADEIIEILNEGEEEEQSFVWIVSCHINTSVQYNRNQLIRESHFLGDLLRQIDENRGEITDKALSYFVSNRKAARHLEGFNEDEKEEILEASEKLLIQELLKE